MAILNSSAQNKEHAGKYNCSVFIPNFHLYLLQMHQACVFKPFLPRLTISLHGLIAKPKLLLYVELKEHLRKVKLWADNKIRVIVDFYKGNPEEIKCVTSFLEGIPKVCELLYPRKRIYEILAHPPLRAQFPPKV